MHVHAWGVVLLAAFPEQGGDVRLVGALVAREADVAVQPVEAAAHPRDEDEARHHVLQPFAEGAAPGEHGGDDLLVPGRAVRLEPVAVVVPAQVREELEPLARKPLEFHSRRVPDRLPLAPEPMFS